MILSTAARNAALNAVLALLNTSPPGKAKFRTSGDVVVSTLTLSNPAFANASNGVATANAISLDLSAVGGTMAKMTLEDGAGTIVVTLTAGTTGEVAMTSAVVGAGVEVALDSLQITQPAS